MIAVPVMIAITVAMKLSLKLTRVGCTTFLIFNLSFFDASFEFLTRVGCPTFLYKLIVTINRASLLNIWNVDLY